MLWSHYSNSHKGFCVAFDSLALAQNIRSSFLHIQIVSHDVDVVYSSTYPILIPTKNITPSEYIEKPLSTKASYWSYEEEKRFILFDISRVPLKLKPEVYDSIILGCNISNDDKSEIIEISNNKLPKVKIYQAKKNFTNYALDFERIL